MARAPAWCTWFAILLAAAAAQDTVRVVGDLNNVVFRLEEIRLASGSKTTDHGGTGDADEIVVRLSCMDDDSSESDESKKHEITYEQTFVSLGGDGPSVTCRNPSTYPHLTIEMFESDFLQNDKGQKYLSGASILLLPVGSQFKTRVWISVKHLLKDLANTIGTEWFEVCLMDVVSVASAAAGGGSASMIAQRVRERMAQLALKQVSEVAMEKALSAAGISTQSAVSGTTFGALTSKLNVLNPCVNPVDKVMEGANWDGALYELTLSVHEGEPPPSQFPWGVVVAVVLCACCCCGCFVLLSNKESS